MTATQVRARRYREIRGSRHARGYDARWVRASKAFLRRYPLCGMRIGDIAPVMSRCYDEGRTTAAYQVDHVVPHRGDRAKFWDRANWQSLCDSCGKAKSAAGW
jgi:5-methylcytosine-specific restriction protein A